MLDELGINLRDFPSDRLPGRPLGKCVHPMAPVTEDVRTGNSPVLKQIAMRMTLKTFMARMLVFLSAVAASGAANAVPLGTCGSSGANLLSDFVTTAGPPFTSNGNSCTADDETFSTFTYFPQGDFAPGVGANSVPPAAVGVASADPTTNCPTNATCPGLVFTANWNSTAVLGDVFIQFTVTAPTASINDVQLGVSGATGSGVVDTPIINGVPLNLNSTNSFRAALTFPTPQTTVSISDDMEVPAGFAATDIEKQFSQAVPAPLIGRGLPVLLAVGGLLFGAKLLERIKKLRPQFG